MSISHTLSPMFRLGVVATFGLLSLSFIFMFVKIFRRIAPPSTVGGLMPGTDRDRILHAEAVVRRARTTFLRPGMAVGSVIAFLIVHNGLLSIPVAISFVAVFWVFQMVGTRLWWKWALKQGADLALVDELASEARLVWDRDTWFGRRQRRTWMRFPEDDEDARVLAHVATKLPER